MFRSCSLFFFSLALVVSPLVVRAQISDPETERRVDTLLKQMTVEEKAGQLNQLAGTNAQAIESVKQGKVGSFLGVLGAIEANELQRAAVEHSRLKIPLIFGYDVIHGFRTIFPVPLASASSFDPALIEQGE